MNDLKKTKHNLEIIVKALKSLSVKYSSLKSFFDREHQVLSCHDFAALKQILEEKKDLGLAIRKETEKIKETLMKSESLSEYTLSAFLGLVKEHKEFFGDKLVVSFEEECKNFWKILGRAEYQIDRNKSVVGRLLDHHQESIKFWAELIQSRCGNYGDVRKNKELDMSLQLNIKT